MWLMAFPITRQKIFLAMMHILLDYTSRRTVVFVSRERYTIEKKFGPSNFIRGFICIVVFFRRFFIVCVQQ